MILKTLAKGRGLLPFNQLGQRFHDLIFGVKDILQSMQLESIHCLDSLLKCPMTLVLPRGHLILENAVPENQFHSTATGGSVGVCIVPPPGFF